MSFETCRNDRDRILGLLAKLVRAQGSDVEGDSGALRHLGIAALNLSEECSPQVLLEVGRVMPWLGVYRLWEAGASVEEIAQVLVEERLVRHLGGDLLRRRLAQVVEEAPSVIRRAPGASASAASQARERALSAVMKIDRSLDELKSLSIREQPDRLIGDAGLMVAVLQLGVDELLPDWAVDHRGEALEAFAYFEAADFGEVPAGLGGLGERSTRFMASLAGHLQRHDVLVAVRAALAFSPVDEGEAVSERDLQAFLSRFTVFVADPSLAALTRALIRCRWRAVEHLSGASGLSVMAPWIEYLRGSCAEFAEARGITLREATNFAHYSLHLLDLFDLSVMDGVETGEELRRAILDVEEELKEFALAGQREGLTDQQADLYRYERSRGRSTSPQVLLAQRLARLCGAWRKGYQPGPVGSAGSVNGPIVDACEALIADEAEAFELDAVEHLLSRARLKKHDVLRGLKPATVLRLLTFALASARDADAIEGGGSFVVDLSYLNDWFEGGDRQQRQEAFSYLLTRRSLEEILLKPDCGQVLGLLARVSSRRVVLTMETSPEFEALLTLIAQADDDEFKAQLAERLQRLFERKEPGRPAPEKTSAAASTASEAAPKPSANGAQEAREVTG